jgi:hypothetical protein
VVRRRARNPEPRGGRPVLFCSEARRTHVATLRALRSDRTPSPGGVHVDVRSDQRCRVRGGRHVRAARGPDRGHAAPLRRPRRRNGTSAQRRLDVGPIDACRALRFTPVGSGVDLATRGSVDSQRRQGIDPCRATRGNVASAKRHDNEQQCDARESCGIGRADMK